MRSRKWLYGRNVVISGVSSGMGKDIAKILVNKYGCKVFGIARNVAKLEALAEELGDNFQFMSMDISTRENWELIVARLKEVDFRPDVLINNAGIIHPFIPFDTLSDKEVDRVIATNYLSIVYSMRAMYPLLKESPYRAIVNVCSASAYLPCAGASVYSSSKSAALSFTEVVKEELQGKGFYVASVNPGPVKTDIYKARGNEGENTAKVKDNAIEGFGLTSEAAAKKIVRRIRACRVRITVGFIASLMSGFYRAFPAFSLKVVGGVMRHLPLQTYKDLFADEKKAKKK